MARASLYFHIDWDAHFSRSPVSAYWTYPRTQDNSCINQTPALLAAGIINTLTDFLVVMLPLHTVWGLKLPNCQQIVVKVLFAFGFCVCAAGIARTYVMYQTTMSHDRTWTSHSEWLVGGIELYLGVVSPPLMQCISVDMALLSLCSESNYIGI